MRNKIFKVNENKNDLNHQSIVPLIIFLFSISIIATSLAIIYLHVLDLKTFKKIKEINFLLQEYTLTEKIIDIIPSDNKEEFLKNKDYLYSLLDTLKDYSEIDNSLLTLKKEIDKIQTSIKTDDNKKLSLNIKEFRKKINLSRRKILNQITNNIKTIFSGYQHKQVFMLGMFFIVYLFSLLMMLKLYFRIKQNELSYNNQIAKIALLSEEKQNFLSTMSHEIRTPLNGIIGIIALLKHKLRGKDQETESLLNKLEFASNHLVSLINDILTFSKLERNKETITSSEFDIEETILEITEFYAPKAMENNTELLVKIDPLLPVTVIGDKHKLTQILTNLINNSIKYTTNGFVKVIVSREKEYKKEIYLKFEIEDSGIGIPENHLDKIFEPFKQIADPSIKPKEGTGLGLPICKSLVSLLGGEIFIESQVNKGTKISFTIPFKIAKRFNDIYLETIKEISICTCTEENEKLYPLYKDLFESFKMKHFYMFSSPDELISYLKEQNNSQNRILMFWDTDHAKTKLKSFKEIIENLSEKMALCLLGVSHNTVISDYIVEHAKQFEKKKIWFVEKPLTRSKILNLIMEHYYKKDRKLYSTESPGTAYERDEKMLKNKKILIVDDNNLNRDILTKLFKTVGAIPIPSSSGIDALFVIDTETPDLIIMDYHMPFMNGKECAKKIREKGYSMPIILLSGDVFAEPQMEEKGTIFDEILTKPINFQLLLKITSSLLKTNSINIEKESPSFAFPLLSNIYKEKEEFANALKIAKKDLADNLAQLKKHIENKNYEEAKSIAHKMKGTISYFNSPETVELLNKFETECLRTDSNKKLLELFSEIEKNVNKILTIINRELGE